MELMPIDILLVDDSPTDVLMTREALSKKSYKSLTVVEDGVEAMKYLRKQDPYTNAIRPDLIVLDLNLPKKDGREVLAELKNDDALRIIPVIILTTSAAQDDILKAYTNHANCYVTKPVDYHSFASVVKIIEQFWLSVVALPEKNSNAV